MQVKSLSDAPVVMRSPSQGTQRSWPILPESRSGPVWPVRADKDDSTLARDADPLTDALGRSLTDLRISVTDRCNFRCGYCMPRSSFGPGHRFKDRSELLTFDELTRLTSLFLPLGVRKLRITGGEPLLRKNVEHLIERLHGLRTLNGSPPEIALTTNGSILARKATALKAAGLNRVTVSLDALDDHTFRKMSDADCSVADVLKGIEAAQRAGLGPIKVNMVVRRGVNADQVLPMVEHFRHTGVELRFIEYMDVGTTNRWQSAEVVTASSILASITQRHALVPLERSAGDTAKRYAHQDGSGHIGFIASVSEPFCGDCTRLRLSADGQLHTCLFSTAGYDVRQRLRSAEPDDSIALALRALWQQRADRYSEQRADNMASHITSTTSASARVEMSYIGG
jgi:cyclic pyranopterin phosphate synthase